MSSNDGAPGGNLRYNWTMISEPRLAPRQHRRCRAGWQAGGLALALVITTLTGCTPSGPGAAFERYLARLGRTLSVAPQDSMPTPTAPLPAPRQLHLDLAPGNLGPLDFLALSGCAVQVTIGKRNSSLGRMARASQRLLLDLEYLRLAPACVELQREQGETALAATLQQAWAVKRQQLPALVFNATLASSEYRAFWKSPPAPGDYPANTSSAVITSLAAINGHVRRWLAGDFQANNRDFELLLADVTSGDGGALRQALAAQSGALAGANRMLQQRMDRGPLCAPGLRPEAADILANVVRKYFIAGIQPRAAALNRRYHELLPPITELEALLENALPPAYQTWRQQRDEQLAALTRAPRKHVTQLQTIQQACGTNPMPAAP
jgi:hypothetical protein